MKTQCVIVLLLGLFPLIITGQQTAQKCEQEVNGCTAEFSFAQQMQQSQSGFDLNATCSIVDEFMTCVNTVLAPCDVITKNTLRSAIDQLIGIYTNPPYGCKLDFAETFEYGNCSQQVTKCAFFKYAAEELKDNATEACKEFDGFIECMERNTTACVGAEQTEIVQSIQNTTNTFNQCPYACNRRDLVCTTVTETTTTSSAVFTVSVLATPVMSSVAISDMDLSDYYEYSITPSEVFYNPSDGLSMYTADLSEFYSLDPASGTTAILESEFPSESDYAGASDVVVVATETQTSTTTSQLSTDKSSTSSTVFKTTLTSRTTQPSTSKSPEGTTTTPPPQTSSTTDQDKTKPTSHGTKTSDKTTTSSATTTTSTTTTVKPTTKPTVNQQPTSTVDTTAKTTTDFPTPNYDNAAVFTQVSAITVLTSLVLAMMS